MKKDIYTYPAIVAKYKSHISITFPDLPGCISSAASIDEVDKEAKEGLALHLFGMEEDGFPIPEPSSLDAIKLKKNEAVMLITVFMPLYRNAIDNVTVKTTVTMPQWLKRLSEEKNINFSQVLQSALKEKLGISDYKQTMQ